MELESPGSTQMDRGRYLTNSPDEYFRTADLFVGLEKDTCVNYHCYVPTVIAGHGEKRE